MKKLLIALAATTAMATAAQAEGELNIYNWVEYTSPEMIAKFEKETGIKVTIDTYDTNETLLAKLKAGGTGYDVVMPSQHFVEIMVKEGLLQDTGVGQMANYKNLDPRWQKPSWDPEAKYCAPWQWGTASVAYRKDLYGKELTSLKEFFEPDEAVKGKVQVFKSPDEVYNMANIYLGKPFCSEDAEDAKAVQALFEGQKPFVVTYNSENQNDNLANGTSIMANNWNGFSMRARMDSKTDIHYAYPKEGVVGWFDSACVPVGAKNAENAKKFLDFIMKPENIALQSNYARYSNAIAGSEAFMDKDLAEADELKVPESVPVKFGQACSPAAQKLIDRVWTKLLQ
ncbi:MAG: extracellular solute-binding protein [Alphaproteobacteria bacterium]|nr:extracellular solute-binding protein [Alphaproteobacteria bacterium]